VTSDWPLSIVRFASRSGRPTFAQFSQSESPRPDSNRRHLAYKICATRLVPAVHVAGLGRRSKVRVVPPLLSRGVAVGVAVALPDPLIRRRERGRQTHRSPRRRLGAGVPRMARRCVPLGSRWGHLTPALDHGLGIVGVSSHAPGRHRPRCPQLPAVGCHIGHATGTADPVRHERSRDSRATRRDLRKRRRFH
jgi:hypothetical protein